MATLPRNHFPSNASNVGGRSFRPPSPHCGLEQQRIKAAPVREEGPSLREEAEEPDYDQKPLVNLDSSGMGHRAASASIAVEILSALERIALYWSSLRSAPSLP